MVTENKNTDSLTPEIISAPTKHRMPHKRLFIILIVSLSIVLIGFTVWMLYLKSITAIKVGDYRVTKVEYTELIKQAKTIGIDENKARKEIIQGLASRAAADELGVEYDNGTIRVKDAANVKYEYEVPKNGPTDYQVITAYPLAIKPIVGVYEAGGYKASEIKFPFGRYVLGFFGNGLSESDNPKLIENPEAIRADMRYAQDLADQYKADYDKGRLTAEAIVEKVLSDGRLWYGQAANTSDVYYVREDAGIADLVEGRKVSKENMALIRGLKEKKSSDIKQEYYSPTYDVDVPEIQKDNSTQVSWYFVTMDKKIKAQKDLTKKYEELVKEYGRV